jgi:hypothetical protein
MKPADGAEEWGERDLVHPDEENEDARDHG